MDNEVKKIEVGIKNLNVCEWLLFGNIMENDIENDIKELIDTDLDNQLFDEFKNRLQNEEDLKDLEDIDDIEDLEDIGDINKFLNEDIKSTSNKNNPNVSLEQAVMDFKSGIVDAFEYIYSQYKPKLIRYGKRYNNEDLAMELLDIVLLNAAKTFDNTAKTKFNTYFWTCAHNHVNCYRIKNNAQKRAHNKDMKSLQDTCVYKNDGSESDLESKIEDANSGNVQANEELKMSIMALNDCLKSNEITILLKLIDNYTLQEIGDDLGVTAAAICMSLKRISNKSKAAKTLKEILKTQ